jgi:hypothetical protein
MAIWSIVHFTLLPDYRIEVSFADGTSGIADLVRAPAHDVHDSGVMADTFPEA